MGGRNLETLVYRTWRTRNLIEMRIVYGVLSALMFVFMAVQFNDPDGLLWMGIYSVPALWCAMAALWRQCFERMLVRLALWISLALGIAGVIYYWPLTPSFWRKAVWYDVETAREGMGMMIVVIVLLLVLHAARRVGSRRVCVSGGPVES